MSQQLYDPPVETAAPVHDEPWLDDGGPSDRAWWIVWLLVGLGILGAVLWIYLGGGDAGQSGAAADEPAPTQTEAGGGADGGETGTGAPAGETATGETATGETATGETGESGESGDTSGVAGATARSLRLAAGGKPLLGGAKALDLSAFRGERVVARGIPVRSVVANEGFWVGYSKRTRVFVLLRTNRESPFTIHRGDRVSFTGTMRKNPKRFGIQLGVTEREGRTYLRRQGYHVLATRIRRG